MKDNYLNEDENIHEINLDKLQEMIEIAFEKIMNKHKFIKEKPEEPRYVNAAQLCQELEVSRQTFTNWRKNEHYKSAIQSITKHTGSRTTYNIDKLKEYIKNNPGAFSGGREYHYKKMLLPSEQRDFYRFELIEAKIESSKSITSEEGVFYEQHKEKYQKKQ